MAVNPRRANREGAAAAARLHVQLGTQKRIDAEGGHVDVFSVILNYSAQLLFRPLKTLLGAYLPATPTPGILVTTERSLAIQRFTGAHELGHLVLRHEPSLDGKEMLARSLVPGQDEQGEAQEIEADAFATHFMMPRWLIEWHCDRHDWRKEALRRPENVYQLSLRLGASFEATCWTLQRYQLVSAATCRNLRSAAPRDLKLDLLRQHKPDNYKGNVWLLTERDAGTRINGSMNDHFILRLTEHSGGGYLWNFDELAGSGFAIMDDTRDALDPTGIGGHVSRRLTVARGEALRGQFSMTEARPWTPHVPRSQLVVDYDLTGPEVSGLSRVERRRMLEAA